MTAGEALHALEEFVWSEYHRADAELKRTDEPSTRRKLWERREKMYYWREKFNLLISDFYEWDLLDHELRS